MQSHPFDSHVIIRGMVRKEKGCHKEHIGHKENGKEYFVPYVPFAAFIAHPPQEEPPWIEKTENIRSPQE
jgi:hypothetical protein